MRASPERYLNYPVIGIAPTGVLPAQYSLEQFFPPPGSQGTTQGSCTAWSTTFALRTAIEAKRSAAWRPLESTKRQFSPAFVFNKAKQNAGSTNCAGGIFFDTALEILRVYGTPTLDQFSYDPDNCTNVPAQAVLDAARSFTIVTSYRISDLSLLALKSHLADGDPVLVGIDVYPSFDNARGVATITGTGSVRGYHAIVLIGYDDGKSAFRIQNSWGPDWGDQGRAWIDYNTLLAATHEAYLVVPPVTPELITSLASPRRFGIVNDRTRESPVFIHQFMVAGVDPTTTIDSQGHFGVAVSQYTTLAPAQNQARSISEGPTGLKAKVLKRSHAGKTSYAVLIAADLDSDEATLVIERAKRLGFDKSFMITFAEN